MMRNGRAILPRSHHIITRDYDREVLRSELRRFIGT